MSVLQRHLTPAPDASAEVFGRYLVFERIGAGGMATVHRAREVGIAGFERVVALKRLLPHVAENRELVEMFIREARLASKLQHANIAQIYELGNVAGTYFISMELVEGRSLSAVLRRVARTTGSPPPVGVAVALLIQLCEALHYAHSRTDDDGEPIGLIHRDVSPSNLLIARSGHLKVIDFGIARAHRYRENPHTIKGKLPYLSPEAVSGIPLDHRSDIFAVGTVAHELLTGSRLFRGADDYAVIEAVQSREVEPPSWKNPEVPAELDRIVLRALEKVRELRWETCGEMCDELHHLSRRYRLDATNREVAAWLERVENPAPAAGSSDRWKALPLEAPRTFTPSAAGSGVLDESAEVARTTLRSSSALRARGTTAPPPNFGNSYLERSRPAPRRLLAIGGALAVAALAVGAWIWRGGREAPPATSSAELAISVSPEDAQVVVGGRDPIAGSKTVSLEEGIYSVKVASPGFQTWVGTVELEAGQSKALQVALVKQAGRSPPRLSIRAKPTGLELWVDGKRLADKTPANLTLEPGTHRVAIRDDGEELWARRIEAEENHLYEFAPELSKRHHHHHRDRERDRDDRDRDRVVAVAGEDDPAPTEAAQTEPAAPDHQIAAQPEPLPASEEKHESKPPQKLRPQLAGLDGLSLPAVPAPAPPPTAAEPSREKPRTIFGADVHRTAGSMPRFRPYHLEQLTGDARGALRICIDRHGAVSSARILSGGLPAPIKRELLAAVKRWRYRPYREGGAARPACFASPFRIEKP